MNHEPLFYLGSQELTAWSVPRACWPVRTIRVDGRDHLVTRIDPPVNDGVNEVIIGPRYEGDSVHPISEWPLVVNIFVTVQYSARDDARPIDLELIGVGELYRSKAEAATTTGGM